METKESIFSYKTHEKKLISNCLVANEGNVMTSAKDLGFTRATLYRKVKEYGINLKDYRLLGGPNGFGDT